MSEYFDRIQRGIPIEDIEIIDIHAHIGPYFNMHIPACDARSMVKNMDICGIDKAVISANLSWNSDLVLGNNMMLEAIRSHRGRLYGACSVNGNYPDLSLAELERCFAEEKDVKMMKIHPFLTRCKLSDSRMKGIYEFASRKKLLVLVHTWLDNDPYGSMDLFAEVARAYSKIKWIMGHSGGPYGSFHAVELAKQAKNIFLDIALSMCPAQQIEFFVKELGSERVLFGTDNPFIDPRAQVGRVGLAQISYKDKVIIFSANVRRFIDFR